jgi:hypothetical protein
MFGAGKQASRFQKGTAAGAALQCGTHAWYKPWTMRLLGWRDYRIIKSRGGDGGRRGSAGLIIIVAARMVADGPFREAVCTAVRQGDWS